EPEALERVHFFRIAYGPAALLPHALALQLFHPLLNPSFCVDETFARIAHESPSSDNETSHIIRSPRGAATADRSAHDFSARDARLVHRRVRRADPAAGARLAG